MTSVEWLAERLESITQDLFEQAKEMEKQQIIEACNQTEFEDIDGIGIQETITKGEQYYNEKFINE